MVSFPLTGQHSHPGHYGLAKKKKRMEFFPIHMTLKLMFPKERKPNSSLTGHKQFSWQVHTAFLQSLRRRGKEKKKGNKHTFRHLKTMSKCSLCICTAADLIICSKASPIVIHGSSVSSSVTGPSFTRINFRACTGKEHITTSENKSKKSKNKTKS